MYGSCRGEVHVQAQLVAQNLQLLHQLGFGRRVTPQQRQRRERSVNVGRCGHVSQQHELLHQPKATKQD